MDAALIDGVGPLRFAWSVLLPMSMNTVAAMAVIEFVYMWSQYLWPLVSPAARTPPTGAW